MSGSAEISKPDPKLRLCSRYYSQCSARLRIALALKELTYEYHTVDPGLQPYQNGEPVTGASSWEYKKINPSCSVPTLIVEHLNPNGEPQPQIYITQSIAALEYLEEAFPHTSVLMPRDNVQRAAVRSLVNILAADSHPLLTPRVTQRIREQFFNSEAHEESKKAVYEWDVFFVKRGLAVYEAAVGSSAGEYSVGDGVTLADVCLVAAVWTAQRFRVDVEEYPTVWRIFQKMSELDGVKKAHWNCQPDTPEELRGT